MLGAMDILRSGLRRFLNDTDGKALCVPGSLSQGRYRWFINVDFWVTTQPGQVAVFSQLF